MPGHPLNSYALRQIAAHRPIHPWAQDVFNFISSPYRGGLIMMAATVVAILDGTPFSVFLPVVALAFASFGLWLDLGPCTPPQLALIRKLAETDVSAAPFLRRWLRGEPELTQSDFRLVAEYLVEQGRADELLQCENVTSTRLRA